MEDELHFLSNSTVLKSIRDVKLDPILKSNRETRHYKEAEKLKWLLERDNIKQFGQALACLYQTRHDFCSVGDGPAHDGSDVYHVLLGMVHMRAIDGRTCLHKLNKCIMSRFIPTFHVNIT